MNPGLKHNLYVFGLVLIILSFIGCVMSYWLVPFGLPFFATGSVLVFLSSRTSVVKWLTVLVPLILWFPAMLLFLSWYGRLNTTPEAYLIPESYEGRFRVIYGEPCGVEPPIENGRRVLLIPSNGQLIVRYELESGVDHEYYLVDATGRRKRINQIWPGQRIAGMMPGVLLGGSSGNLGSVGRYEAAKTRYTDLYLFNTDTVSDSNGPSEKEFYSAMKELILQCRGIEVEKGAAGTE